ncbi:MAG: hypothetical protein U0354_20020 [Candidatus Sericytochromatia bacterium]
MCGTIGMGSRLVVTIDNQQKSQFNTLDEARKAAKDHQGNEAIVRNDDGSYSLHTISDNPTEEKAIIEKVDNGMVAKGQVSNFAPQVVEFSISNGLWSKSVSTENNVGEKDYMSEVGSEIRGAYLSASKTGKNEFATEDDAIAAAKQHSGIEAVVKGQDAKGNVVYKLYRATEEDVQKIQNNPDYKGKVTAFVVPPMINIPFISSDNVIKVGAPKGSTTGTTATGSTTPVASSTTTSTTSTSSVSSSSSSSTSSSSTSTSTPATETSDYNYGYDFDYDFICGPYSPYIPGEISFPTEAPSSSATSSTSGTTTTQTPTAPSSSEFSLTNPSLTTPTFSTSFGTKYPSTSLLGGAYSNSLLSPTPTSYGSSPTLYPSLGLTNNFSSSSSLYGNGSSFGFNYGLSSGFNYSSGLDNNLGINRKLLLDDDYYSSIDLGAKVNIAETISSNSNYKFNNNISAGNQEEIAHSIDEQKQNIVDNQKALEDKSKEVANNISNVFKDSNSGSSLSLANSAKNITVNDLGDFAKYAKNTDGSDMTDKQLKDFINSSLKNVQSGKMLTPKELIMLSATANFALKNETNLDPKIKESLKNIVETGSSVSSDMDKFSTLIQANNDVIKALEEKLKVLVPESAEAKATKNQIEAIQKNNIDLEANGTDITKVPSQDLINSTLNVELSNIASQISTKNYSDAMKDLNGISDILNDKTKTFEQKIDLISSQFPNTSLSSLVNMKLLNEKSLDGISSKINSLKADLESKGEVKHNEEISANKEATKNIKTPEYQSPIKAKEELAKKTNTMVNDLISLDAQKSNAINEKIYTMLSNANVKVSELPNSLKKYAKNADGSDMTDQQLKECISSAVQKLEKGEKLNPREILLLSGVSANLLKDKNLDPAVKARLEAVVNNGRALKVDMEKFELVTKANNAVINALEDKLKLLDPNSAEAKATRAEINALKRENNSMSPDSTTGADEIIDASLNSGGASNARRMSTLTYSEAMDKGKKIQEIMSNNSLSVRDKVKSLKELGIDVGSLEDLDRQNLLTEERFNIFMNPISDVIKDIQDRGEEQHNQQTAYNHAVEGYDEAENILSNAQKEAAQVKLAVEFAKIAANYGINSTCPIVKAAGAPQALNLETVPMVKIEPEKESEKQDATQTIINERTSDLIKNAEKMEDDLADIDQIDVSSANIINLLREFQRINNEHSLAANNIKASVSKRTGIDRKFAESLKENRERWTKLDESKKEYLTHFKSSNEVQKPMLPASIKKSFDNFEIAKEKSLKVLSKLEYTMKAYQDLIDKGEKPSMKLCMELNNQLDLYKLMCRENDKLFSQLQKILK